MHLGRKAKVPFPERYRGFRLIRTHGRIWGIPPAADPERVLASEQLFTHPAVLSTATLDEMRERIDGYTEPAPITAEERQPAPAAGVPVEFAGWLPVFEVSGNCGKHPQFAHTGSPPPGYRFTRSAPPPEPARLPRPSLWDRTAGRVVRAVGKAVHCVTTVARIAVAFVKPRRGVTLTARVRVFLAMLRMAAYLLRRGCRLGPTVRFLQARHLQSQLLVGDRRELVFLTSMPYTFGQNPWVIEIEDPTTLFYPHVQNGHTCDLPLADSPYFAIVKALLEADHCRAILTHMKSTAEMVAALFRSDAITRKIVHSPLGVKLPARWQRHDPAPDDEPIDLLFINSWHQIPESLYVRGGLDVLEAFAILKERYPQLRLTMRTALPALADHYHRIIDAGWVRVINRFLSAEEMAELHASSHIFLLPAARVHIVSLLQAMSYGLAVVGSDGWGMEEYLDDGRNGLVVRGRHGKVSWADTEAGVLRENYEPTYTPDLDVVAGLVEAVSRLVEDRTLRRRLGRAARADVETRYNLANWNLGVKAAFDFARGVPAEAEATPDPVVADEQEVLTG